MKINLKKMLSGLVSGVLLAGLLMSCNPTTGGGSGSGGTGGSGSGGDKPSGNGGSNNVVTLDVGDFEVADTSVQMAKNMAIGWNLGNALDASGNGDWAYTGKYNPSMEYSWLPHKVPASKKLIQTVKAAGFKTIRIPVSWHNQMGRNDSSYTIYPEYLARVKELVDWSLEEGMCVIINIHHDNLTEKEMETNPGFALSTDPDLQEKSKAFITSVWKQVADYFKDYDNNLVFELLNEPRCTGTAWEWGFWGANADKKSTYCNIITDYEQAALDVIRASGGKNKTRYIMCPSYACSGDFFDVYKLPEDAAGVEDRLIYAVHAYTPSDFCLEGNKTVYDSEIEKSIDWTFSQLKSKITEENIGIVMGEASASDKNNYDSRIKWAKYYFKKSVEAGVPVVLWDNEQAIAMGATAGGENHGYFNRQTCKVTWPEMIEAMMTAVYGEEVTGNGTPASGDEGDDTGDADSPVEVVLFDASTLTEAPVLNAQEGGIVKGSCELVEIDGVKYLKITPDEYLTSFNITPKEVSGKIVVTMKGAEDTAGVQAVVKVMDGTWESICAEDASPTMNPISGTAKDYENVIVGKVSAAIIMPMVQNTDDWSARSDTAIYISKIIAK